MAVTTKPYDEFLSDLVAGIHDFSSNTYMLALLTPDYTPDYVNHTSYASVVDYEVSSTGTGYSSQILVMLGTVQDINGGVATVQAQVITIDPLTATVRYAVIYRASNSNVNAKLVGLVDLGSSRGYNNEQFQLAFINGLVSLTSVAA